MPRLCPCCTTPATPLSLSGLQRARRSWALAPELARAAEGPVHLARVGRRRSAPSRLTQFPGPPLAHVTAGGVGGGEVGGTALSHRTGPSRRPPLAVRLPRRLRAAPASAR